MVNKSTSAYYFQNAGNQRYRFEKRKTHFGKNLIYFRLDTAFKLFTFPGVFFLFEGGNALKLIFYTVQQILTFCLPQKQMVVSQGKQVALLMIMTSILLDHI